LRDAHRTLCEAGLRQRVRLRVDGGLKFARDVIIAALLGADEFGFGTSALLAMGCVMARQCHLNTCPVGIATQDEALRARFTGKPEMIESYFRGLAAEARKLLAQLGARRLDEIVGQTQFLRPRREAHSFWVEDLLRPPAKLQESRDAVPANQGVSRQLRDMLGGETLPHVSFGIGNSDRSVGAGLSGAILRKSRAAAKAAPIDVKFHGSAGPSFGAFLTSGVAFQLTGEANDYVGKGLSGGIISIDAGSEASTRGDVLVGNTVLYGATSGELYVAGAAGERFAVRNSGALAVVEGMGEHGCEYMTGGVVLLLGPAGFNLGSGMTGGLLYQPEEYANLWFLNQEFVEHASCSEEEELLLRRVLMKHCLMTGSPRAAVLLNSTQPLPMVRFQPKHLPCSVTQTWEPLLPRLWARKFADGNLFQSEFPTISAQPRGAGALVPAQSVPSPPVSRD
jgi:glutamate synthase domain-containing protein 3